MEILLNELRNCERFTREEEAELHAKMVDGDINARDRLFMSCAPFAVSLASSFYRTALERKNTRANLDDLTQEGLWGLLEAVDRFDPAKGRLMTVAYFRVRRRLLLYFKTNRIIYIPVNKANIVDEKNPGTMFVGTLSKTRRSYDGSDNSPIDNCNPAILAEDADEAQRIMDKVGSLPERQRDILHRRFWRDETLSRIGASMGISKERVRQIQNNALDKIRERCGSCPN